MIQFEISFNPNFSLNEETILIYKIFSLNLKLILNYIRGEYLIYNKFCILTTLSLSFLSIMLFRI